MGCHKLDIRSRFRRIGADTALWNYDPMGNWNSVTIDGTIENRTHNEVNELTSRDSAPLTYDDNGNLTAAELATGEWTFTFNADNRLVSAVSDDAKLAFAYDPFGRRILKKTYLPCWRGRGRHHRRSWQPVREERFFYDKYNMTQIYRKFSCWGWGGRLRLSRSFIWGDDLSGKEQGAGGVGGLVAVVKRYGVFFPTYNAGNGNITAYMTKRGRVVARYVYSPFGRIIKKTGFLADYFTYAFSTKPLDRETGLVYYNYRYYSPQLGRWLSRDPVAEQGGLNLYAMVGNNPERERLKKLSATVDSNIAKLYDAMGRYPSLTILLATLLNSLLNERLSIQYELMMDLLGKRNNANNDNPYLHTGNNPINYYDISGEGAEVMIPVTIILIGGAFTFYSIYQETSFSLKYQEKFKNKNLVEQSKGMKEYVVRSATRNPMPPESGPWGAFLWEWALKLARLCSCSDTKKNTQEDEEDGGIELDILKEMDKNGF